MTDRPQTWIIVFDANVFLDVARLLGEPFDLDRFNDEIAGRFREQFPHPDRRVNALRALAAVTNGSITRTVTAQVWTSEHVDALVRHKANQSDAPWLDERDRGLGWSAENAQRLVDELIWHCVESSGGDTIGDVVIPRDSPPLEHEDGLVYATARDAHASDVLVERFVVTSDRDFLEHGSAQDSYPRALSPANFVALIREVRGREARSRMPKPRVSGLGQ